MPNVCKIKAIIINFFGEIFFDIESIETPISVGKGEAIKSAANTFKIYFLNLPNNFFSSFLIITAKWVFDIFLSSSVISFLINKNSKISLTKAPKPAIKAASQILWPCPNNKSKAVAGAAVNSYT